MSTSPQIANSHEAKDSVIPNDDVQHDGRVVDSEKITDPEKIEPSNNSTTNTTDDEPPAAPIALTEREQHKAQLQKWNEPRTNMIRFFSTLYSFILMGMNDGAIGALIPYVKHLPFYLHGISLPHHTH